MSNFTYFDLFIICQIRKLTHSMKLKNQESIKYLKDELHNSEISWFDTFHKLTHCTLWSIHTLTSSINCKTPTDDNLHKVRNSITWQFPWNLNQSRNSLSIPTPQFAIVHKLTTITHRQFPWNAFFYKSTDP